MTYRQNKLKEHPVSRDSEHKSIIYWLTISFVVFFLFNSAFHTGLFNGYSAQYESAIYSSILTSSMILVLLTIYFFYNWRFESYRDLLSMYIWLVPLTFWVSTIAAASVHLSKNMAYIHMMYATFFLFGLYLARNKLGAAIIQLAITMMGYVVVLFGIANMFGNAYFRDAVMLTDQGYRLTSVFQYANAYAAFLMAILLCCLYYVVHSKKWYNITLHAFMLVPIFISFWLTLSRGGIVTFPIIFLCILPLLSLTRQLAFTVYSAVALLFAFPIIKSSEEKSTQIVKQVWSTMQPDGSVNTLSWFDSKSLSGWGLVLGFAAMAVVVIVLLQRFIVPFLEHRLERFSSRKFSKLVFPTVLVVLACLGTFLLLGTGMKEVLPDNLQKRVENINFNQHSVLERGTFYKDSIKVFKEYPILGAGGGGWASVYEKFQNNPYVSRQAHNFFLQYLVEVGIIGFVIFVLLLIFVLFPFVRKTFRASDLDSHSHLIFYFVTVTLLIHSILDFEMSYVFLGAMVFLCLGGMSSILDGKPALLAKFTNKSFSRFIYPAVVSAIAVFFIITSIINFSADRSYKAALQHAQSGGTLQDVLKPMDNALNLRPNHPEYLMTKTDFMTQVYQQTKQESFYEDAKKSLDHAKQNEPNNRLILEREYALFMYKQQFVEALDLLYNEALIRYPWELSYYERAATLHNALWNKEYSAKNLQAADQNLKAMLEISNNIQSRMEELKKLPENQMQGRPFYVSWKIHYAIGQAYFVSGDLQKATMELQTAGKEALQRLDDIIQQDELEQAKTAVRWYLAVLEKQGKSDKAAMDKLISIDSSERQKVESIAKSQ